MEFVSRIPIEKGWSGDRKYCVTDTNGSRYLLRISPLQHRERTWKEFQQMQKAAKLGIPMCLPLEFGTCEEGTYSLQSWIDGRDAEEVLPGLPEAEQYACGTQAGQILRKIHGLPAPEDIAPWEEMFSGKIDRKLESYAQCPLKYENGERFLEYIREHRHLIEGRPQSCQHGDYHIGNMMIDRSGQLVIIDFNRWDFGDPWEEFNRIVWCVQKSPLFASGMVNGYWDGAVPDEFWKLLALYISVNTISSLPWAIPFGEEEIAVMRSQAKDVLSWYDDLKTCIPSWYISK